VETILLVFHVLLSLAIIGLVLLQRGKGAEAGAALGGGGGASATVFGARGAANFLSRTTAVLATAFFISSLALAYIASDRDVPTSVTETIEQSAQQQPAADNAEMPALPSDMPDAPVSGDSQNDLPPAE
jgi:preprotein translocase subunit SecG